jgi:hypothetical protein
VTAGSAVPPTVAGTARTAVTAVAAGLGAGHGAVLADLHDDLGAGLGDAAVRRPACCMMRCADRQDHAMTVPRDRDAEGRARQARPRDALGRPLPYGTPGVEPVSEDPLPPDETLRVARGLVDEGRPFSAHEVLEARWKAGPEAERDLWQGLAQVCVGLTHAARGNATGAERLLERAVEHLDRYAGSDGPTYGLDLPSLTACARRRVAGEP